MTTKISAGRGRPRSFDPEEAVAVAQRLFHERGYDGLSVADIGAALSIRPPSFYAAFGSKAGLFERVLERYQAQEGNWAAEAMSEGRDVADSISLVFARAAQVYANCDGKAGCLVLDSTRNSGDPEAIALTDAIKARAHQFYADEFRPECPERADELANSVMIALSGMSSAARDGMGEAQLARFAETIAKGFRLDLAQA